jgi:hypothetical protein
MIKNVEHVYLFVLHAWSGMAGEGGLYVRELTRKVEFALSIPPNTMSNSAKTC